MLLLETFLNAALVFSVPLLATPFGLRPSVLAVTESYANQSPSQLNLTSPSLLTGSPTHKPVCLGHVTGLDLTAVAEDCSFILNDVILRLDGVFQERTFFGRRGYLDSKGHEVSARWAHGKCIVYVGAARPQIGSFTLFEVALTANKILSDCIVSYKRAGGLMSIGLHELSFYVDVQEYTTGVGINNVKDAAVSASATLDVSKQNLDVKRAIRGTTGLQRLNLGSSGLLMPFNHSFPPSGPLRHPATNLGHELECFEPGARLPNTIADDCSFVINTIILGMDDPFEMKSWGYGDDVDINLSLEKYHWQFGGCYIRVRNIDEERIDIFRLVDVAALAQSIVQKCVIDAKTPLGGAADIGHLILVQSFYVVVSGVDIVGQSRKNSTTMSLPSDEPRTLESRASLSPRQEHTISNVVTEGLQAGEGYPVRCLDPEPIPGHRMRLAVASDCAFIIQGMILRLPNPMLEQTFGFTDADDVDLSNRANGRWIYRSCAVFIGAFDRTSRDHFRFVDVALATQKVLDNCVEEPEYTLGGIIDIGRVEYNFYVAVGGLGRAGVGNGPSLGLVSGTIVPASSAAIPASNSSYTHRGTEPVQLHKRSNTIT